MFPHQNLWQIYGKIYCAGPIRTEIWHDLIRNAEPVANSASLFAGQVQTAHALSVTEASKRSWFWEPEVIGKYVWKVSLMADLHAPAVGSHALIRRREGLLHVMKVGSTHEHGLALLISGSRIAIGLLWMSMNI